MEDCGHIPVWSGQRVERTNARGRHRYCVPFKAWIVEKALQPGMSTAGLAMRNQVNANQLRRWVKLHLQGAGGAAYPSGQPILIRPVRA
jgi:transposase-like protein